ncbi:hypothetical protein C8R47DRAFT_391643 [Mycena vitilis]|nr:hypothetical protein C8R47DRAFT_391643 [Mycena vitilis]
MFFAETDMLPGEEDAADVPAGYSMFSLPRKPLLNDSRRGGGIALMICDTYKFAKSNLSSPDFLVLDMGSIWLIGAYIPPATSRWEGWTDVEPREKFWETVALCAQCEDKPVVSLGDINARTGSLQSSSAGQEWVERLRRVSADPDEKINSRGRAFVQECDTYNLSILNGTSLERSSPGRLTSWQPNGESSWQPNGESTIDYGFVSNNLLPMVHEFHVELPTEDPDDNWADNMRICITLDAKVFERTTVLREHQTKPDFGGSEYIDQLYQETMDAKETKDEALESLWGPVLCQSAPTHIYVEGVAAKGNNMTCPSGAGIFFGPGFRSNSALRVPGPVIS